MAAPSAAPTASRGTPPSARRSSRHTAPSHPSSTIDASTPTNPAQRSWSFLSVTNLTILAAESLGSGGLPGRKPAISISATNTMPASASERSDLRSSTRPPLRGNRPPIDGAPCRSPFASIVRFADGCRRARTAHPVAVVAGGIIIAVVMLLLLPVAVMLGGAIWSALLGWLLVDDAERRAAPEQPGAPDPSERYSLPGDQRGGPKR